MKKMAFLFIAFIALFNTASALNNFPFSVKEVGSGTNAVILIPGFACSGDVWNETVDQLKSNHKCYVFNMAGFARVAPKGNPDIKNWVEQIALFIQENKIDRPVIIGHSLGGVMAQWLAADYPQLVSKIVVVDALPCLPAIANPTFETKQNPDCGQFVSGFSAMDDKSFYQMQKVGMASMLSDTGKLESVVQWSMHSDRSTMALIYCQLLNTDLRSKIKSVKCPTLVMLEPSFKALQSSVEDQYKNLKGAQLHYADKGLHFIMYDDKAWYFEQLKNFIQ